MNPYATPNTTDVRTAPKLSFAILFSGAWWLAVTIGILFGRRVMVPIYADFGVELPTITQFLIHPAAAALAGAATISVLLLAFMLPSNQSRNIVALLSTTVAILAGVICVYGLLRPLAVLIVSLGS